MNEKKSLFGISQKYLEIISEVEENDGVITEDISAELIITEADLEDKIRAYRSVMQAIKAEDEFIKEERKRLSAKSHAKDNLIDRMKANLVNAVTLFGIPGKTNYSLKYPDFTVFTKDTYSISYDDEKFPEILYDITEDNLESQFLETADKIGNVAFVVKVPFTKAYEFYKLIENIPNCKYDSTIDLDKKRISDLINSITDISNKIDILNATGKENEAKALEESLISYEEVFDEFNIRRNKGTTIIFK